MSKARPLSTHLALSHGLIGLFACLAVGIILGLLLPTFYLRQRESTLMATGRAIAVSIAPTLARGDTVEESALGTPECGRAMIVDAHQQVVAMSPSPGCGMCKRDGGSCSCMGIGQGRMAEVDKAWQHHWREILAGQALQERVSLADRRRAFVGAVPTSHAGRVVGAVVLYARLADLQGASSALVPPVLIALLLVAALSIVAGSWVSRRMARPLRRMTEVVERVSEGDLSRRIEPPAWEEGEALARSFNRMTEALSAQETARRQFITDASHQLRAPLTSLQAQAEALLDGMVSDEPRRQRFLMRILDDAKGLSALAQELLDLECLESGPRAPLPAEFDVGQVLSDVADAFMSVDGVPVVLEISADLPTAYADPSEVRQAVVNLVSNALRHSPVGGTVLLEAQLHNSRIRVAVKDQGRGIPARELDLVWEPFYRVPGDTTGGSGLGLAIVRRLIERQGGRVGAESEPGAGSIFWFELPSAPRDLSRV